MSNLIAAPAWKTTMPTVRKFVFISLCEQANDYGECYPSISSISKRCCVNKRTVYRCLNDLEAGGYLVREKHPGRRVNLYRVTKPDIWNEEDASSPKGDRASPVTPCHGDTQSLSMVTHSHPDSDTVSPPYILDRTIKEPSREPSGRARARRASHARGARLSIDWVLPEDWGEWARQEHPDWTPEQVQRVAAQFRDHWLAKAGADACKVDWQATWRNWIRREPSFSGAARTGGFGTGPPSQAQRDAENARAKALLFGPKSEVIDV